MSSLSPAEQERAVREIVLSYHLLTHEGRSWEEIAQRFDYGSVEAMSIQFARWGMPDWLRPDVSTEAARQKRKPRQSSPTVSLPEAGNAAPLFLERIEALRRAVENLSHLVESAQGRRFVSTSVYDDPVVFFRDQFSEDEWQKVCECQGEDPASDRIFATGLSTRAPIGASQAPPRPLVNLIAAYALADGDMNELLRVLHPKPSEADAEKLSRLLYAKKREHGEDGLLRRAEQVATLIRGGKLGRGAPPPDILPREHNTACHITHRREHGWSWDQICEDLAPKGFTRDDVSRLGALNLRWPEK